MRYVSFLLLFLFMPLGLAQIAEPAEISAPDTLLQENNIVVSSGLALNDKELGDLKNGISKEIVFYVDLFRVWSNWPDEFVLGKSVTRTLKCDPIRKEYVATSFDGLTLTEKRFKGCDTLYAWALGVKDMRLTNTSELDAGKYFVRVTAESRLRRLPPVIGYLFFFVRETEFKISADSKVFEAGGRR